MQIISVTKASEQPTDYPIMIGCSLYDFAAWFPKKKFSHIVIITDHRVKKKYGLHLQKKLKHAGHNALLFSFPAGEKSKNYKTKQAIENNMHIHHCDRDTLILALGGGVVGDVAGFIAATFLRGVAYIQIPTTLLAMVDSSVGGKTGINTKQGKNLIGIIYQPIAVLTDVTLLKTLSKKNMINGLVEAIKIFLTHDAQSFHYTELHLEQIIKSDNSLLSEIVARAVNIKAAVVTRDEKEQAERSVLNFGHTIGHALEKISNYTLLHGYAVAYGILVEATISHLLGLLPYEKLLIIKKLFSRLNIHGKNLQQYNLTKILQTTKMDKKIREGNVHYVLLQEIGHIHIHHGKYIHPVVDKIVKQAFKNTIEE